MRVALLLVIATAVLVACLLAASWVSGPTTKNAGWTWDNGFGNGALVGA